MKFTRFLSACCLAICCLALPAAGGPQQPSAEEQALSAKIEKYMDLARNGRAAVRPQAAKRLVKLGDPACKRLLAACGEGGAGMPALGPFLIEVLADFEEPALRAMLWQHLIDADFPWRGPAARSLSHRVQGAEVGAWVQSLRDPLDQVRLAATQAMVQLDGLGVNPNSCRARAGLIVRLHQDPSDRVRRAAALQLDLWGEPAYLMWLVEDLKRTDTYFRLPHGEQARFASIRGLRKRLGDDFGFRAEDSPLEPHNAKAIGQLTRAVLERSAGEVKILPEFVLAGQRTEGDVLGLELRSCRVGEFFLRWNRNDVLYVGTGRARAIALPAGSVARLQAAMPALLEPLGKERFWGEAGCDLEQLRMLDEAGRVITYLVSKGQAAVPDLRPGALDGAVRLLVDSIPERAKARDGSDLRGEVSRALEVLGGGFRDAE